MALRPGYKDSEIGPIPDDWDAVSLGELGQALIGLTYAPSDVSNDGTLVLRSSNIQNDALAFTDNVFVTCPIPEKIMVRPGDVLICVRNGSADLIGKTALLDDRVIGMTFGAFMAVFRSEIGPLVNYCFQSSIMKRQINEHLGATINQITNKSLNSFKVPLPRRREEQQAIAEALTDVDAAIDGVTRLLAKKRDLRTAAMQRLLTGDARLADFDEPWVETSIAAMVRHHSGNSGLIKGKLAQNPVSGFFPGYSASGQDVWLERFEHDGDAIIVSAVGSRCGKSFLAKGKWSAIANTHVIWPDPKKVDIRFLLLFLNDEDYWEKGGSGQPFILFKKTFAKTILLPPIEEQAAIADVLQDIDDEISSISARLTKMKALKQAMMQALLTGRVRLPVADVERADKEPAHA